MKLLTKTFHNKAVLILIHLLYITHLITESLPSKHYANNDSNSNRSSQHPFPRESISKKAIPVNLQVNYDLTDANGFRNFSLAQIKLTSKTSSDQIQLTLELKSEKTSHCSTCTQSPHLRPGQLIP
jgi:hypothetical protein